MEHKERVIAYIDGFNLYFGLKENSYERYLWLNLNALVTNLLKHNQELVTIKYFTTLVTNNSSKRLRQKTYVSALLTLKNLEIFYGRFQRGDANCAACGNTTQTITEKMTDVAIASNMIHDAYQDKFDTALLISGDTDLIPPINIITSNFKNKKVTLALPPNRGNDDIKRAANAWFVIGRKKFADSQFDDTIEDKYGEKLSRPGNWV